MGGWMLGNGLKLRLGRWKGCEVRNKERPWIGFWTGVGLSHPPPMRPPVSEANGGIDVSAILRLSSYHSHV